MSISASTKETAVYVWRFVLTGVLGFSAWFLWNAALQSTETARALTALATSVGDLRTEVNALKLSYGETKAAVSLTVIRTQDEHTREIAELRASDTRLRDELAALKIADAKREAAVSTLERLAERGGQLPPKVPR